MITVGQEAYSATPYFNLNFSLGNEREISAFLYLTGFYLCGDRRYNTSLSC
jgi:hypothetical protein